MSTRLIFVLAALGTVLAGAATAVATSSAPRENPVFERVPSQRKASTTPKTKKRMFPDLKGVDLDGKDLSLSDFAGKRLILVFYRPDDASTHPIVDAVARVAPLRREHNFQIVGVSVGSRTEIARAFAIARGLDFPIIDDGNQELVTYMRLKRPAALTVTDGERHVLASQTRFSKSVSDLDKRVEGLLREALRLPRQSARETAEQLEAPIAPDFEAELLGGGSFSLSEMRGKPLAIVFFLHDCPYCHAALMTLKELLPEIPEDHRPKLVGVEISGRVSVILDSLKEAELDFFPVIADSDWKLRTSYGVFDDVPVIVMVNAEGRIVYRTKAGWDGSRDPAIVRSWMMQLAGRPVPMLLPEHGFSGSDLCGACHTAEHATWNVTAHASAYETLVKRGANENEECVKCHVVGFGQPGGFTLGQSKGLKPTDFEDVGCESCHGPGGPHQSPDFVTGANYAPVCVGCHDHKHSIGFEYDSFRPKISHQALAAMSTEDLQALIAARGTRNVLPTGADFVGSDACRSCHSAEFGTWKASPHAHSLASLSAKQEGQNPECQRCHTTGFGRPGGFPSGADAQQHADLARVGCESCHGPGGDHVGESAARIGTIVSLTDKCDSCAIQKVCGACHDEANDPDFAFDIEAHIERQRHGTTQPAVLRNEASAAPAQAGTSPD